jgi:ribosome-interacting GTPase 1
VIKKVVALLKDLKQEKQVKKKKKLKQKGDARIALIGFPSGLEKIQTQQYSWKINTFEQINQHRV